MKSLRLFIALLLISGNINAQTDFGMGVDWVIPTGAFKNSMNNMGWGITFDLNHHIRKSPITVGLQFDFITMENDEHEIHGSFNEVVDDYTVGASSQIYGMTANLRYDIYKSKVITLFANLNVGVNNFRYYASVSHYDPKWYDYWWYYYSDSYSTDFSIKKNCYAFRIGPGTGMDVAISKSKKDFVFLRFDYLLGAPATYYTDVNVDEFTFTATEQHSQTSFLLIQGGVKFVFGKQGSK